MTDPSTHSSELRQGELIDKRYEVMEHIAAGGMGDVYLAIDHRTPPRRRPRVALKILAEKPLVRGAEARFLNEAWLLELLDHPHVVRFRSMGRFGPGRWYLAMDYIEGVTLEQHLAGGPLPVDEAIAIADQLADALGAVHEQGVVHRDLKPRNVMLDLGLHVNACVQLIDLGLAKASDGALTAAGVFVGSAAYASTEQLNGGHVDRRSDLFAVGALLYEMLTGTRPFDGRSARQLRYQHRLTRPLAPSSLHVALPRGLDELVMRMLDPNPSKRPRDAFETRLLLHRIRSAPLSPRPRRSTSPFTKTRRSTAPDVQASA